MTDIITLLTSTITTLISEPLSHSFMQHALITALLVGTTCSLFSCFLVLKGWSLMGDAVSHAVLPGLVCAYILGLPLLIGAFAAGLTCALGTSFITHRTPIKEDTSLGIIFSGMFALGLILLTKIETDLHLMHILFGNILGITQNDLLQALTLCTIACSILLIKRKDFTLYCFDPTHAKTIGLRVKYLHLTLLTLLTLTIVAALKAAGLILVIAMLITPGATAFLLTKSFGQMITVSCISGALCCITGTLLSYHIDAATAPLIVTLQGTLFLLALLVHKITGP